MGGGGRRFSRGGHFFLAAPIYKKPAKPNFLRVLGQNKTKKTSKKFPRGGHLFLATSVGGGALIFGKVREPKSPPHPRP